MSQDDSNEKQGEIEHHLTKAFCLMGMDLTDESVIDTPARFRRYIAEFMQPFDPETLLGNGFENKSNDAHCLVAQASIPFRMVCEHHLLPATGRAAIGYLPHKRVVGLSKLTRLVQAVGTEKPSLQETICDRVADILFKTIDARGVIVLVQAEHGCMSCRGVNSPGVITATSSIRGMFLTVPALREEFFRMIGSGK